MSEQGLIELPRDQQWEYATLTTSQTAGFFGTIGAQHSVEWSSTLDDEGTIAFEQSGTDLLHRVGRAGWELVTSTTASRSRGGTTHEILIVLLFKQHRASTEEQAIAQLIDPNALLKVATRCLNQQKSSMAMNALDRAFGLMPQQHLDLFHLCRGRVYLALGQEDNALQSFEQAIHSSYECGEGYMEIANILIRRKDYANAIDRYTIALNQIRDDQDRNTRLIADIRYNRAIAHREIGKPKDASKDLKEYLKRVQLDAQKRGEIEREIKELEQRR
jgi:predicted negative regulator of RcsB-dependent stress response